LEGQPTGDPYNELETAMTFDDLRADSRERLGERLARLGPLLTTQEVSERTRIPPETLRYFRHRGIGPKSFKLGRRVLYAAEDVEAWIAAARESGAA
jgi:predicted DNA-binding transcriptional regulator AlpA